MQPFKGHRSEKPFAELAKIREEFELPEEDVVVTPAGVKGVDVQLSNRARECFPFAVEAKNQEAINIWQSLKQVQGHDDSLTPLLVFKRNRSEVFCALSFVDFMRLAVKLYELKSIIGEQHGESHGQLRRMQKLGALRRTAGNRHSALGSGFSPDGIVHDGGRGEKSR